MNMTEQVIKTEKDLDEAIKSLDDKSKSLDEKRKQSIRRRLLLGIGLGVMVIAFWIFFFYQLMTISTFHGYLRVVVPLYYAFVLISLVGALIGNIQRYRQRHWDYQKTLFDTKWGILNSVLITVFLNVLLISNMITYREQLFFWPQVTSDGLNIPSVVVMAPLLFGVNWLFVHVIRKRLHELHVFRDKGSKTA